MSSGDYSDQVTEDNNMTNEGSSRSWSCEQRPPIQSNVYTPLSLNQCEESQQIAGTLVSYNPTRKSKVITSTKCATGKNQRSSVRPFFCCGSELSLVSLVESIELKNETNEKGLSSIECCSSSDDETLEPPPYRSGSTSEINRHNSSLPRRKKNDKQAKKKKFWSLQTKWNPHWRQRPSAKSKRSKTKLEVSQPSTSSGSTTVPMVSNLNRPSQSVQSVSTTSPQSPFLELYHFFPIDNIPDETGGPRSEDLSVGLDIEIRAQVSRAFRSNVDVSGSLMDILRFRSRLSSANSEILNSSDSPIEELLMTNLLSQVQNPSGSLDAWKSPSVQQVHTQIDYAHYLVPDLTKITSCSYYWGVMDRYEAERLLDNKPPGTFLLRDSAQEDFLFSVSFRRYNRSLHARIEQWNHRFSFDIHDPNVFSASTVCELVEHYKDPSLCMFFEPMLTRPLHRNFPFSLQHMSRTVICDRIAYDDIQALPIPNSFKKFLQTYHYKHRIRVRRFDMPEMASAGARVVN